MRKTQDWAERVRYLGVDEKGMDSHDDEENSMENVLYKLSN